MSLRDEIREQPAAAERQLASSRPALAALVERLRKQPVDLVVVAARGTSDHAAIYAQYLLGTFHRLPVALAAPSIQSLYEVVARFDRALVIGISQSGASPDIVGVVAAARDQGAPTLAITNDPGSRPGRAADHVIELAAGPERAIAATKTYTAELLAIARLSAALAGRPHGDVTARRIPGRDRPGARQSRPRSRAWPPRLAPSTRCVGPGSRLRVRHRPRVGAQAQGARPGLRRPVLRGRLPARPARPDRARLPGPRRRRRPARPPRTSSACCDGSATSHRVVCWSSPIVTMRAPWARAVALPQASRTGSCRSSRSCRPSCSPTT